MKKIILAVSLLLMASQPQQARETDRADIPLITLGTTTVKGESTIRGGMPNFFGKIKAGKPVTVAYIGGSITEGGFCYRLQLSKYLENLYKDTDFTWVNAGVSGTGSELGVFRLDEQVMKSKPDLVFIDFSVNGAYTPAMEAIIRKIRRQSPATDICLLYAATGPHMREYQKGVIPAVVAEEERLAEHYNIPSVHMAKEAASLEAAGKLIWKGKRGEEGEKILFSTDGLHPTKAGGNLYAAAVARAMAKCSDAPATMTTDLPAPLYGTEWESARMYSPAEICTKHGLWKDVDISKDPKLKKFSSWFPSVMTSGHPASTLSFAFEGDMFGLFDIGGPESGQLEIYVDGQMIRLKNISDGTCKMYQSTPLTGSHYLNRFNRYCNNRYRGQFDLIKVEPGLHQVTIKLSDKNSDKSRILGEKQQQDITENPEKYDKTYLRLGRILVRGNIAECHPVKGLPKMAQQLKWEKKITDYMEHDAEQSKWDDATLVVGSSSIDLWKSLETDFPGKHVIRRGVSGTKAIDLYNYRNLLIEPFSPKRIIIYEGDNEIGFKWEVDEMMDAMKKLFHEVRRMKPDAEIYLVSIKPSPVRVKSLEKIQTVNKLLKEFALSQPNAGYIDIHTPMLDAEGNVRPELFLKDGLHPAKEGYDIWREEFGKIINK